MVAAGAIAGGAFATEPGDEVRELVRMPGDRLFYLKREAGAAQFRLVTRTGAAGRERVLVDPEALRKAGGMPHAIDYFVPSWDGKRLAYGMSTGGSEDASLYLMDVASGKLRDLFEGTPYELPRADPGAGHFDIAPDGRHLAGRHHPFQHGGGGLRGFDQDAVLCKSCK